MSFLDKYTLWRNQSLRAKLGQLGHIIRPTGPSALRHLSDRHARDIGLNVTELERIRFEYPSRISHHPRL
jgi:hypothetical protein